MRVRKLALAVGLVSALGGNAALALGLGEAKLNSVLNQPLNAEIRLLQIRDLGENEIKVRLASPEDFERAGVDRSYLLTELRFDVDYSGAEPVIRVSSRSPIREPFLNFLVETRWPSGRLLREYTLLMDLPAFSETAASQPVRAAERERQQVQRQAPAVAPQSALEPAPRAEAVAAPQPEPLQAQEQAESAQAEPAAGPEAAVDERPTNPAPRQELAEEEPLELRRESAAAEQSQVYGPVSANETLWEIALRNRDNRELSVQQTMLAIQRLNPEAFINGNINLLKKGAVLRLPNVDQMRELTLSEAISEVAAQNESWRGRINAPEATAAPLDARAVSEDSSSGDSVEGRVSLAAPGDNEAVLSGTGSGADESEALSGELTVTEEELDKSRLESEELRERISELDEQIDTMERLVEVSNDELQAVQEASSRAEPSVDPLAATEASERAPESQADSAEPEEVDAAADQRNRVVVMADKEPTLIERALDNIVPIGIGIGGLLLALGGLLVVRRRKAAEEEEAIRLVEAEMLAERSLGDAPEGFETEDALSDEELQDHFGEGDFVELDDVGTDDPVSEAEIHLSLGQHAEAEAKLIAGLEQSPQHVDARLMLLEVYAQQQDIGKFDEHYRQLLAVDDGHAADRAARLRETIAGAGEFEAPASMGFSGGSLPDDSLPDDFLSSDSLSGDSLSGESLSGDSLESGQLDDLGGSLEDDFSLDLDTDFNLDSELNGDSGFGELGGGIEQPMADGHDDGDSDSFNIDDLVSPELGLDSLDLEGDGSADSLAGSEPADDFGGLDLDLDFDIDTNTAAGETGIPTVEESQSLEDDGGLDFDLDLSSVADTGSELGALSESAAASTDSGFDEDGFEDFGDLGGELDLESVDLDSVDLGSADLDAASLDEISVGQSATQPSASGAPAAAAGNDTDFEDLGFDLGSDLNSELDLLEGSDEVGTKLELAQAYMDMGDSEGARDILNEVVEEGQGEHRDRAREMLERMA
ncbi:hypothetical protein Maes01_00292 [Microbulbifer aestuariivivens]|uniref:FimV N-terminal domain-containing protein n=1 Tax=Microbulbifer aestuariivivens TaxID=1908308 RepID=A0ABP9WKL2_9GAMM